jgi:predicted DNA binding CopG/RHH family protein
LANPNPERSLQLALLSAAIESEFLDLHHGENSRGFIMKEPKLNELEVDREGTRQIRRRMATTQSVKITINIDKDNLDRLRAQASKTGIPYQRLLNRFLTQALQMDKESESRLSRLEKEVSALKRKIVA